MNDLDTLIAYARHAGSLQGGLHTMMEIWVSLRLGHALPAGMFIVGMEYDTFTGDVVFEHLDWERTDD